MTKEKAKPEKTEASGGSADSLPGLVAAAAWIIEDTGQTGADIDEIYSGIITKFPSYDPKAVKSTIRKIVPETINREVFTVEKTADGRYRRAK